MKKNGVVFGLLFLLQAAFFAGCNVGLGESIDVDSPVLEIKYPPIAATIRDKFILYGTWGDDKGVTSVAVSLVNTDTKEKVGSFLATVNSDKTWQLELNEFDSETRKFKYIDGSYQVSAAAYDAAGHTSGESSRTFDIDNSAPVFVISNPGVVKSENLDASAYGSVFTIDGTIADDHTISLMDVAIYDEDGNLLSHETYDSEQIDFFREEEIATAGGTSVTIAQFADNPTTTANNRYSNVYGTDSKAGTKKYYASVTVTDSAKVYQNPTEKERSAIEAKSDSFGNSTSNVYLYDDVYTTLMSAKKGLGLSAADLKNILNGTETNEAALAVLNEKVRATSESEDNRLYFSLNPEANPTYTISGYALDFSDESSIQQASNGNTVTVTVNAGLDGVNVNPATVKLWMLQFDSMPTADEASSKASALAAKVKSAESAASADGEKTISDEKLAEIESEGWRLVFENSDYQGSSVSVKSMAMMLPSNGILMNKYYLLVVTGSDADDVEFSQKSAFGFKGTVSGIAPTIFIKSPMNGDFVVASDLVFSGTAMVTNPSLSMSELKATITASDGSSILGNQSGYSVSLHYNATSEEENPVDKWSAEEAFKVISSEKDADSGVDVFTWEFDPSKVSGFSSDATGATKYTLDVYGSSSSGHDVTASSMVQLDVTPPDVKITTITPTVSGADVSDAVKASDGYNENNVYINGTIRIMGSIVEQNLKTVKYDVLASHNLNADFSEKNSDGSYKYSILDVMYEDSDGYYDGELDPSNSIDVLFETTKVTEGMLRAAAIAKDAPIKIRIVFTAIDKVNNSASYSSAEYNGGNDFLIYQETDKPKIKFGNADESITNSEEIQVGTNLFGTTNNNKLQVTVSDDDSVKNFKIHVLDADGIEVSSENVTGGKTIVDKSYTLPSSEEKYQIKVEAFDEYFENTSSEYAKNTVGPFFVAVDSGAPNIEISSPTAGSFQSRQVDVEGFVKKPNVKVSGTLYSVSGENLTPISNGTGGTQVGSDISTLASPNSLGEYIWTDTVMLPSNANGGYKLEYTATDSYGQTAASSRAFVVDITPPRFAITELDSVSVASTVRSVVTNKDVYTVKGTISDGEATSGIKDVYYKIVSDGNNPETVTDSFGRTIYNVDSTGWERAAVAATTSKGEYTFTANVEIGTYTRVNGTEFKKVYFAVKDEAGNVSVPSECSDSSSLRISLDTVPPATTLEGTGLKKPASSLSSSVTGTKDDAGNLVLSANAVIYSDITYYATGDYSIGGTITEASDTATVKVDGVSAEIDGSKWTFPRKTTDGTYTHQIVISDAAGNSSNTSVSVIRDTVPPTLIVSNDTTDNDALNVKKIITEENGNYSTEIDTSGKTVHKYLLSGKWSDSTSGTSILQYQVYPKHEGGANYSENWSEWRTVDGVTKSTAESSWTISVPMTEGNGLGQGVGLRGRAVDAAGNVCVHSGHEGLTLDFSVPEISLTSVVPSYVKEGETLTITGTCSDSYALDKLECTAKKDGATVESGSNGYTFTYIPGTMNPLGQVKNGTFEIKVESGSTNNGKWTFDLAVTDKANRTTKLDTVSTVIDTVKPSWGSFLVNKAEYSYTNENEHSWYKSSALPFAGTLSEEGSGIREIVYSVIQAGSGGTATYSKSFATTKDSENGTESFSVNLGEFISNVSGGNAIPNDVYMKAIDYAGNESEVQIFHIYIDAEEPSLLCDRSGNVYSDLETEISVTGTMDDDASGVSSVKLTISDTATSSSFTPIEVNATLVGDSEWHAEIMKDDVLSKLEDGHIYAVKAAVTDKAENSSSSTIFRIHIDKTPPYVQTYSVSNSHSKYKVHSAGNDEYFVHNSNTFKDEDGNVKKDAGGNVVEDDRNIFTISGVAMDSSSGVEKVEFTLTNTEDSSKKITRTAESSIFDFDDIDLTGWEGGAVGKFVITDGAGNQGDKYNGETEEFEIKLSFDNDAPKGIHAIDGTGKDIFLRVGDNDNDEVATLTDNDKKVGGKYSVDTYGNEQTIKLRGTIFDGIGGSGISMIYYKVIPSGNTPQEQASLKVIADKFLEEYETDTENTGYFKPNRTEDKRVFYTPRSGGKIYDADGNDVVFSDSDSVFSGFAKDFGTTDSKNYATITTNYDNVFSGFDVGVNYVVLVAVDNVGNAALDSVNVVEPSGKTRYYNYSLNVDTESPDAKAFGETTKYATESGTVVIEGEASDDASGIKSVAIKVNDKQIKEDVNATDGSGTRTVSEYGTLIVGEQTTETDEDGTTKKKKAWRVELDAEKVFAGDNGTKTVYAIVTDKAGKGNKSTVSVANVIVDTQEPTVSFNAISDAEADVEGKESTLGTQINGNVTLSGTVSDENILPENAITGLRYNTVSSTLANDSADWHDFGSIAGVSLGLSGSYTFTISGFDTTKLADGKYYIQAVAKDTAENIGYSEPVEVEIRQDTDRPKVNITNLDYDSSFGYLLKYGTRSQVSLRISDDDIGSNKVIERLVISKSAYNGEGDPTDAYSLVKSSYSTGEFTFEPAETDDGEKRFHIYIEDNAGGKFYTTATASIIKGNPNTGNPKILLKEDALSESVNGSVFVYNSDSKYPTVVGGGKGIPYSSSKEIAKDDSLTVYSLENANSTLTANYLIGGTARKYVKFHFVGNDASGISGMTLDITAPDKSEKYATSLLITGADTNGYTVTAESPFAVTTNASSNAEWTTDYIDVSDWGTGQVSAMLKVYDRIGLGTTNSFSFAVDNAAPVLKIQSPERGKEKTGVVSFVGSSNDSGSAGLYDVRWLIPTVSEVTTASSKVADAEHNLTKEQVKYAYLKDLATSGGKSKWNGGEAALATGNGVSLSSWTFDFDGNIDEENSDKANFIFAAGNPKLDEYRSGDFASSVSNGVYTFPVYFMAVDTLGNYIIDDTFSVIYNPDADRPKVEFSYPTVRNYDSGKDYVTLGGTIRASGSAEIPSNTTTVAQVFLQIANKDGGFTGTASSTTETDDSYVAKNVYGFEVVDAYSVINGIKGTSYSASSELSEGDLSNFGFTSNEEMRSWWGIPATGTGSWNIAMNGNDQMNPSDDNSTNDIVIRACAVNALGKMGAWSLGDNKIEIHIDNNMPTMSASINQYAAEIASDSDASANSTATVSQNYSPDMFLRGQWYLVIDVLDESGIKNSIVVKSESGNETFYKTAITTSDNAKSGYRLYIPIDKDKTAVKYTVKANENTDAAHQTEQSYSFNIDNIPPTLEDLTGNGDPLTNSATVCEKQLLYSIAGNSTDEGSGVERVVFYYMRKNGATKSGIASDDEVILDPMIPASGSDYSSAKVNIHDSTIETLTIEQDSDNSYELYARKISGSSTLTTFTASSAFDSHVRVGGLIFIDGVYRRISAISGSTVTFEPSVSNAYASIDAYFPIAQVIDNSMTEKTSSAESNTFVFEKGDDGDLMPESFSKSSRTWTWDASVHSTNLPDGPISLVILAFDVAGNVNGTRIDTMVSNNAPRVAKLFLATDLNGNSKFEDEEFESYSMIEKTGNAQEKFELSFADFGSKVFTAKDKLAVVPEIVGGNGNISLVAKKDAENANPVSKAIGTQISAIASATAENTEPTELAAISGATSAYSVTASNFKSSELSSASDKSKAQTFYAYVLENSVLAGIDEFESNKATADGRLANEAADGDNKAFSFTFWDSTELTELGTDSQNAVILVKDFTFDLTDGVSPKVVVNPFYWKSLTENSVYASSAATSYSNLKGHIELEKDLSDTLKSDYGDDPKVSGIVTFTGTAYDDHSLLALSFTISDSSGSAYEKFSSKQIGTYDSEDSSWTPNEATIAADGYEVKIVSSGSANGVYDDDTYFGQSGHKIFWTLSVDTEQIDTVVAKDVKLTVIATDTSGNETSIASADVVSPVVSVNYIPASSVGSRTVKDGETNVPTYTMDVMPYITKVTTSLSSLKKNNPSVYARTALGHYAVRSDETITFTGFNLNGNTSLAVSTMAKSGEYSLKVKAGTSDDADEIEALNNLNGNDAKGVYDKTVDLDSSPTGSKSIYDNYYNRCPNGDNNNLLTDDVVLDVWDVNSKVGKPAAGVLTQPVMDINPVSGKVGFAFRNGALMMSMGSQDYSYDYWLCGLDVWTSIGFAYDDLGYGWGTAAGGDINASSADSFALLSSRWGTGTLADTDNGHNNGTNQIRPYTIGQKDYDESGNSFVNIDKERFQSPTLATTVDGTASTVYLAYYDNINNEIRFHWGTFTTNTKTAKMVQNLFYDAYGKSNAINGKEITNDVAKYRLDYTSLIAGQTQNANPYTNTPKDTRVLATDGTAVCAGQYVSIAALKGKGDDGDDAVVAVWYDATNNQMLYSYNKKPKSIAAGKFLQADTGWSKPEAIFGEDNGIGEYCKVALDKKGGAHVVAYDSLNADVVYAYIPSFDTPSEAATCIVDSYGLIGTELDIDVALDDGENPLPFISYYAGSNARPKSAKWAGKTALSAASLASGADDDVFTGAWDVSLIPTSSKVAIDHTNVGVWKDKDTGKIKDSVLGTNKTEQTGSSYKSTVSRGNIFGNGSKNSILGYAINEGVNGYIETAQMR